MIASSRTAVTIIANPVAGRGRVRAALADIEARLQHPTGRSELRLTSGSGDARRIAREAILDGAELVVAVGGDGTVHEVVNGMVDAGAPEKSDVALAVVAAGSGCDFIRTFGIPADVVAACAVAFGRTARSVDLVAMRTGNAAAPRHFCNIAEVGLGGENIHRAVELPRWLGGSRYLVSFWLTLAAYRPVQAKVTVDGRLAHDGRAVNIVVANAAYFGGGMHISPRSDPGDGKIDVLVFHGPKSDAFTLVPRIYRGTHLPHPNVLELRGANVRVESTPAVEVEADGEAAGSTPVSFTVVPGAIRLKVPMAPTASAAPP